MNEDIIKQLISDETNNMEHSFIREILKVTKGVTGVISLAGGLPHPDTFPRKVLSKLFSEVIENEGHEVLQYGASEGDLTFKHAIKDFEEVPYLSDDELLITVGSTNGIFYFTKTFIDKGDIIICEAPSFPGSITSMEACGAKLEGVEMDNLGMIPELLKKKIDYLNDRGGKIKFIYLIPEFQNPTGKTMDQKRRVEILNIAKQYDLPILEDQPYRELRFSGERIPTLWELARTEFNDPKIVTIAKSFSKILGPGLRLGFASGPPEIIGQMAKWAQKVNVSPDCLTQRVTAKFIDRGFMKSHIKEIIDIYRPKRDSILNALEKYMPSDVKWTVPEGGMFVWLTFNSGTDTTSLFDKALKKGVAFIPGEKFYPKATAKKNELRLNFSYPTIPQIDEGIKRLAGLI